MPARGWRGALLLYCTLVLLSSVRGDVVQLTLRTRCRGWPKTTLPCYDVQALRESERHTVYFTPRNVSVATRVDVGVYHAPGASHASAAGFALVRGVYWGDSEMVVETPLGSAFALHEGDEVSICSGGEACVPCLPSSAWDPTVETCVCQRNARLDGEELASATVLALAGGADPGDEVVVRTRAQCVLCEEYEIAVDGQNEDGEAAEVCACDETFGETTIAERNALDFGVGNCRCDAGKFARGSSADGTAECAPCEQGTYKPIFGNQACDACPPGEVTTSDGRSCECPSGRGFTLQYAELAVYRQLFPAMTEPRCVCAPGYEYNAAAHACALCGYDAVNTETSRAACEACPATLVANTARLACECPAGAEAVIDEAQQRIAECRCEAGSAHADDGRLCEPCPINTFRASAAAADECVPCSALEIAAQGSAVCSCMAGASRVAGSCACQSGFVRRESIDPREYPATVTAPPYAVVEHADHPLHGPGRVFYASDFDVAQFVPGAVDVYVYRPGEPRVLQSVMLYRDTFPYSVAASGGLWGHRLAPDAAASNATALGAVALLGTSRLDWRAGDVLVLSSDAPQDAVCLPCASTAACSACADASTTYSLATQSCSAAPEVQDPPCGDWSHQAAGGSCTACPLLERAADGGACVCAPGHEPGPTGSALRCAPCAAGFFKADTGDHVCVPCAAGFIASPGAASCSACGDDEAAVGATCYPCAPNSSPDIATRKQCVCDAEYERGLDGVCEKCVENHFKEEQGDHLCAPCPPLQENVPPSQRVSCSCSAGATVNVSEPASCVPCAVGSFKNAAGNAECTACAEGRSTVSTGARNVSQCVCAPGWFLAERGECEKCPPDSFQEFAGAVGSEQCRACPFRQFQPAEGAARCVPQNVPLPTDVDARVVGLFVRANRSCAIMARPNGFGTDEVCWGDGLLSPQLHEDVAPSVGPVCGDGIVFPFLEECDDGNINGGDGCSGSCIVEPGFFCELRDLADFDNTLAHPSRCCRRYDSPWALTGHCSRCWSRTPPWEGVEYTGLDCALRDVDECKSAALNECVLNGTQCENLDATVGPHAQTHRCVCRGACHWTDPANPSAYFTHLPLPTESNVSHDRLFESAASLVHGALLGVHIGESIAVAEVASWDAMQTLSLFWNLTFIDRFV